MVDSSGVPSHRPADPPEPPRADQPCLLFNGKLIPLHNIQSFIIGRDGHAAHFVIPDRRVSRRHARITCGGGRYTIRDLGSVNGTFVNDERVSESFGLLPGDEIVIPPHKMTFVLATKRDVEIASAGGTPPTIQPKGHFSGLLDTLHVADLIQLLNSTHRSGTLTLRDLDKKVGHMTFIHGEIVAADYDGKTGEKAVYDMVALKEGDFEFAQGSPTMPAEPIRRKTMPMLLEGCRLFDEDRSKTQSIPFRPE